MNALLDHMHTHLDNCAEKSPFLLENEGEYQSWRQRKLQRRAQLAPIRVFAVENDGCIADTERAALRRQVEAYSFVVFESSAELGKAAFLTLNRQFGLNRLDANPGSDEDRVTALRVVPENDQRAQYIPYTNRALKWHTDGYYNAHDQRINAFALYCVTQAGRGGGNYLFDHELMYLLIRDQSPELLAALMSNDLMHIPANLQDNRVVRAEESGPVFSVSPDSCVLNMRYTSRPQNIVWKPDKLSQRALNLVREILLDSDAVIEIRLRDRQGIVCNNILHGRQAFADDETASSRLIYRARYYDSINIDQDSLGAGRG